MYAYKKDLKFNQPVIDHISNLERKVSLWQEFICPIADGAKAATPELKIDQRDFLNIAVGVIGDFTEENKKAAVQMVEDFYTGDPEKRKPWLDKLFDKRESYHPQSWTLGSDSKYDHEWMEAVENQLLNQVIGVKGLTENPGYVGQRYDSAEKFVAFDLRETFSVSSSGYIGAVMMANGYDASSYRPNGMDAPDMKEICEDILDSSYYSLRRTEYDFAISQAALEGRNIKKEKQVIINEDPQNRDSLFSTLLDYSSPHRNRADKSGLNIFDTIFINGVSAAEKYREQLGSRNAEGEYSNDDNVRKMITNDLLDGKNRIETAMILQDKSGKAKIDLVAIKPEFEAMKKETGLKAWIGRTFPEICKKIAPDWLPREMKRDNAWGGYGEGERAKAEKNLNEKYKEQLKKVDLVMPSEKDKTVERSEKQKETSLAEEKQKVDLKQVEHEQKVEEAQIAGKELSSVEQRKAVTEIQADDMERRNEQERQM